MKRIIGIIGALALSLGVFTSCDFEYDYYEPAFYDDTIDYTISALGGDYPIQYKFVYYESKATVRREFDFVYRLIIDGVATEALEPMDVTRDYDTNGDRIYTFYVSIPTNTTGHLDGADVLNLNPRVSDSGIFLSHSRVNTFLHGYFFRYSRRNARIALAK